MVIGAFAYAGQICISVQRLFVHDSVYEPFMERFIAAATGLKLGDPLDPATDVGPMVDANAVGRRSAGSPKRFPSAASRCWAASRRACSFRQRSSMECR